MSSPIFSLVRPNEIASNLPLKIKILPQSLSIKKIEKKEFFNSDIDFNWLDTIPLLERYFKNIEYQIYTKNNLVGYVNCTFINTKEIMKQAYTLGEIVNKKENSNIELKDVINSILNEEGTTLSKLVEPFSNILYINEIYVLNKYRKEGIGKYLFRSVESIIPAVYGYTFESILFQYKYFINTLIDEDLSKDITDTFVKNEHKRLHSTFKKLEYEEYINCNGDMLYIKNLYYPWDDVVEIYEE